MQLHAISTSKKNEGMHLKERSNLVNRILRGRKQITVGHSWRKCNANVFSGSCSAVLPSEVFPQNYRLLLKYAMA